MRAIAVHRDQQLRWVFDIIGHIEIVVEIDLGG
jgi:hypothetical protein